MFRPASRFTTSLLAVAFWLAGFGSSAIAAPASPPNFSPNPSARWFSYSRVYIPPSSGPGPVRPHPQHRLVSNDEFRATGAQTTFPMGDPDSPILLPWARDALRTHNALILSGKPAFSPTASCWPAGVTYFLLRPMTLPLYFVQAPDKVLLISAGFNDVRRIHLNAPHSPSLKPSWYGESVGHYEGDTLVVDTIGLNGRTFIDNFRTPHTEQLHVVERFRLTDGGETLEVNVYVEDPGAFTAPWRAIQRFRRFEELVARSAVGTLAVLATPDEGPLIEMVCAENPYSLMGMEAFPLPQTTIPDF